MKLTKFPLWFPNRHCTQCDVGWESYGQEGDDMCWVCANGSHVKKLSTVHRDVQLHSGRLNESHVT